MMIHVNMGEYVDKPTSIPFGRRDGEPYGTYTPFPGLDAPEPSSVPNPHIGSIVWYNDVHSIKPYPAIVLSHDDGDSVDAAIVDLLVIGSDGFSWKTDIEYGTEPDEWRWPE